MLSEKKYPGLRFRSHLAPEIDERIHPVNGGFWGYSPSSNHCPFCLSEDWHGGNPGLGDRLIALVGLALGVLVCGLLGALLFKVQWWLCVEGQWPLLTLGTCAVSVSAGYHFYNWFVDC